jgi:hypothetical protein
MALVESQGGTVVYRGFKLHHAAIRGPQALLCRGKQARADAGTTRLGHHVNRDDVSSSTPVGVPYEKANDLTGVSGCGVGR